MAEQEEFKFPDEIDADKAVTSAGGVEKFEIEVDDDTPPEDRNKVPVPKEIVEDIDNDNLDEYSKKVKDRFIQMKKVYHDERRAKEAAAREREEALKFAQAQMEENRQLKQRLSHGEKAFIQEVSKSATNEMGVAKEKLRQAYESGDADRITEAQEALLEAKLKLKDVERFQPSLQSTEEGVQPRQQAQAPQAVSAPAVDPKAQAWMQRNTWFGVNKGMTAFALGLHEELVGDGVDPRSDEYYAKVDQTLRRRFPENFEDNDAQQNVEQIEKSVARNKPANVVAPVTRTTAPRRTIRLTTSQVALAKKLGLSNEQYAEALMNLENNNG
jgi:hypothetical protein